MFALFVISVKCIVNRYQLFCLTDYIQLYIRKSIILMTVWNSNTIWIALLIRQWSNSIGLSLNLDKCKVMSYFKVHSRLIHKYSISDFNLVRYNECIIDLGEFNHRLEPRHIVEMVNFRALMVHGFIKKMAKNSRQ